MALGRTGLSGVTARADLVQFGRKKHSCSLMPNNSRFAFWPCFNSVSRFAGNNVHMPMINGLVAAWTTSAEEIDARCWQRAKNPLRHLLTKHCNRISRG